MDSNDDGSISLEEAPEGMRDRFADMDRDGDGQLDKPEIEQIVQLRSQQGGTGVRGGQPQQFNPQAIKGRVMASDANGDGFISRKELPQQMQRRFDQMDANGDGSVDENGFD